MGGFFFVYCHKEFHCERIYYDADFFSEMLEKLSMFFFQLSFVFCRVNINDEQKLCYN